MRYLIVFALLLFATTASAADAKPFVDSWHVTVNTFTYHTRDNDDYNNVNPGLGALARHGNWLGAAGAYDNSYDKLTVYGVVGWQPVIAEWHKVQLRTGLIGGLASGYDGHNEVSPLFGGGVISLQGEKLGGHLIILPPGDADAATAISLMFSFKL